MAKAVGGIGSLTGHVRNLCGCLRSKRADRYEIGCTVCHCGAVAVQLCLISRVTLRGIHACKVINSPKRSNFDINLYLNVEIPAGTLLRMW